MNRNAITLEDALALRAAATQAVDALLPLRNAHPHTTPEYRALNSIINAAVDTAEQAAKDYVDAHIIPAPQNPSPGFTAKMAALKADLADTAHHNWDMCGYAPDLTGRTYVSQSGAVWYEEVAADELNGPDWITADLPVDPRGFSTKYEHCGYDVRGYLL